MPTVAEVEEALQHLRAIPAAERGPAWHAYADALLEQFGTAPEAREVESSIA